MKKNILSIVFLLGVITIINGQSYKIMTYNIRYDNPFDGENQWAKRKEFLSSQIAFYEPDVFGIQEGLHHQVTYLDSTLTDYNFLGIGRDDAKTKGEYSAIFYNSRKLKVVDEDTFWLSETPNEISVGWDASMERICTYALFIDIEKEKQFWVFNTHFDHIGNKARIHSVELILEKIKELNTQNFPVIVMGDFNLKPTSKPIQTISKILNDTKLTSSSKPFGPQGTFNGFNFHEPVIDRIDYLFTSKNNIEVNKYAVLSDSKNCKYPSDHLPVFIEIKIK
jgi:endonuclease/exonuclease/phosphatase family metal-dependent hydrolase